ncbi:MAG: glycosyltransferase family 39 protein [Chthoniobacteraceae bacterium]
MTWPRALLILTVFWALIFLPALGTTEYKGEEPRRVLPAVSMLQTGNLVVPMLCGEPFLRKPPLVNWLIAASFHLTGKQNEWAARLPSVLAVWLLGAGIFLFCRRWLGVETALVAAMIAITHVGMVDKGRMAEIEAEYIALSGLATVGWLALHRRKASPWQQWLVAGTLLGISFLAKGPVNLIFFYPVVLGVLIAEREWRTLFSPAHLAGLVVMFGIFALWAVPYWHQAPANAAQVMAHQTAGRFSSNFNFSNWVLAIPRGLSNFLPWVLLAPLCWRRTVLEREGTWYVATRNTSVALFLIILLLPGMLPRYSQPLLIPMSLLIAIALQDAPQVLLERWKKFLPWARQATPVSLVLASSALICVGILVYAIAALTVVSSHDNLRPLGRSINKAAEATKPLYLLDCGYQPFFAYVTQRCIYLQQREDLPPGAAQILLSNREWKRLHKADASYEVKKTIPIDKKDQLFLVTRKA